jgi:DNA-binding transcriptional LysR family regulator
MQIGDRIARRMKLHDLRILMAVAQAGSMNKAAVFINMTQSAVSRSIAELERTVGVSLLDRTARGAEPTEYGRAMLECGVAVFDDLRHYADIRIMPSRWPFVLVIGLFGPAYRHNPGLHTGRFAVDFAVFT